ncbi:hypothetical protein N8E89_00705 [Phyllobacterium sp. A18/5-2]|nr:hypothetical protein [Phyllobacterium sp. A18/5-2]UXN64442.1 hypothetical protein N8E89_00705 [Phyllobacterium sp. A18/5-2]
MAIHTIADPNAAATVMKGARAQLNSTPIVRNGCYLDEQPNENF